MGLIEIAVGTSVTIVACVLLWRAAEMEED